MEATEFHYSIAFILLAAAKFITAATKAYKTYKANKAK